MDITDLPSVRRALHWSGLDARPARLLTAYARVVLLLKEREALALALNAAREELRQAVAEANHAS